MADRGHGLTKQVEVEEGGWVDEETLSGRWAGFTVSSRTRS